MKPFLISGTNVDGWIWECVVLADSSEEAIKTYSTEYPQFTEVVECLGCTN